MAKCPNCTGGLRFDIKSQQLACDYCGSFFDPYSVTDENDAEKDNFRVNVFRCPNCYGELYTTDDSATGFCSYCGSSVILESRIAKEKRPAYIIPFKLTKEDCAEILTRHMKSAIFTPKEYRDPKKLERFRGIYMPYWVYSTSINEPSAVTATQQYTTGGYDYTDYYLVQADLKANISGLAYDASSSFEDPISEAIAPFPAKELKRFTPAFLSGFYGDVPDVDALVYQNDAADIMSGAVTGSFQELLGTDEQISRSTISKSTHSSAKEISPEKDLNPQDLVARNLKAENTMLPVWFLSYRNGNRVAYAVVNGVTGAVSCDLPVSMGKILLTSLLVAVPLYFLLNLLLITTPPEALAITVILAQVTSSTFFFNVLKIASQDAHAEDRGYQFLKEYGRKKEASAAISAETSKLARIGSSQKSLSMKKVPKKGTGEGALGDSDTFSKVKSLKKTKRSKNEIGSTEKISDYEEFVPENEFKDETKKNSASNRLVLSIFIALGMLIMLVILLILVIYLEAPLILVIAVYGFIQILTTLFGMFKKERKPRINIPIRILTMGSSFLGFLFIVFNDQKIGPYSKDEIYYFLMLLIYFTILITLVAILKQLNIIATRPLPQLNREGGDDSAPEL